jgi:hypothetical protein
VDTLDKYDVPECVSVRVWKSLSCEKTDFFHRCREKRNLHFPTGTLFPQFMFLQVIKERNTGVRTVALCLLVLTCFSLFSVYLKMSRRKVFVLLFLKIFKLHNKRTKFFPPPPLFAREVASFHQNSISKYWTHFLCPLRPESISP